MFIVNLFQKLYIMFIGKNIVHLKSLLNKLQIKIKIKWFNNLQRLLNYKNLYKIVSANASNKKTSGYIDISENEFNKNDLFVKLIAFYLPQFHPIPENDIWWGKGFTEWTNVSKAVPQFLDHYQPRLPGELGYYDLRIPEIQHRQVELAKKYGIYGFCFYYYWFDGKRLLDHPLDQFTNDKSIDFPFCLCWANENWTRRWDGLENDVLMKQVHSIENDYSIIEDIINYFRHPNYIQIEKRPLLIVYRAKELKDPKKTTQRWREFCRGKGIADPFLVAVHCFGFYADPRDIGFDAALEFPPHIMNQKDFSTDILFLNHNFKGKVHDYTEIVKMMLNKEKVEYPIFKTVMPSWDNTARKLDSSTIFINSSPVEYQRWLQSIVKQTFLENENHEKRLVFINAWNEWAEGAYLEPDRKYGYAYLQATSNALLSLKSDIKTGNWSILFVSHDANLGGAQKSFLSIINWFKNHTFIQVRILCLGGGRLLSDFEKISNVLVLQPDDISSEQSCTERVIDFCGGIPALIYANTVVSARAYRCLSRLSVPIITHVRELESSIQKYASAFIGDLLEYTSVYISNSHAVQRNLVAKYGVSKKNCFVAHTFIQADEEFIFDNSQRKGLRKQLGLKHDGFLVLGIGVGMPFRKGVDLFIKTAGFLAESGLDDWHFYWIGDFEHDVIDSQYGKWNEVADQMKCKGLDKYITFLGWKNDVKKYLRAGNLLFLSSREEPFGRVMLEAAECELPVIAFSDSGGPKEFINPNIGFLVDNYDCKIVAEKIIELKNNEDLCRKLGVCGRRHVLEKYSINHIMPKILSRVRKVADKKPLVSIIVTNYNHMRYLPKRLKSIFNQTFQDYEVILMDDCSTDDSLKIYDQYADRDNVAVLRNKKNSGSPFKQWIKAFSKVRGELIWIAESDDWCELNFLQKLIPAFNDSDVNLAYCASRIINDNDEIVGDYRDGIYLKSISANRWNKSYCIPAVQEVNEALGIKNTILNISSVIFRRMKFDEDFKCNLRNMTSGGDTFLLLNVIKGGKVFYEATPLNFHRRHSESIVGKIVSDSNEKRLYKYFQDFYTNHIYTAKNYKLSSDFPDKLEKYIHELWVTLAPNRPYEDIHAYLSVSDIMQEIKRSAE